MINVSTITAQIEEWLEDDPELAGTTVERGEFVNEDPGRASKGWIGIYRQGVDYEPRHMGTGPNNYEGELEFIVLVQQTNIKSGALCEDALEGLVKKVLDRVVQLPKDYIDHFPNITIEYTYQETDRKTMYFQGALITFTAEVSFEVK